MNCVWITGFGYREYFGQRGKVLIILLCVRWYLVYNLSLRNVKETMAERGIDLDHSTVHR